MLGVGVGVGVGVSVVHTVTVVTPTVVRVLIVVVVLFVIGTILYNAISQKRAYDEAHPAEAASAASH